MIKSDVTYVRIHNAITRTRVIYTFVLNHGASLIQPGELHERNSDTVFHKKCVTRII
jgi:hypothetical protein